jgi:hypothetical protein
MKVIDNQGVELKDNFWEIIGFDYSNTDYLGHFLRFNNFCAGSSMAFKRSFLEEFIPFVIHKELLHDTQIAIKAILQSKIRPINNLLSKYRKHSNQSIGIALENKHCGFSLLEQLNIDYYALVRAHLLKEIYEIDVLNQYNQIFEKSKKAYLNSFSTTKKLLYKIYWHFKNPFNIK